VVFSLPVHPVEIAFRRSALALLPPGARVLVAVSGGGDSVALLHLLVRLAPSRSLDLAVAHLDHALRRGSGEDRRFVERLARDLGLPFLSDRRPVASLRARDESPEEAARRVRRAFLLEAMRQAGAARIALGHTLDDQAETILMRLARGAGPSALAGISAEGPGPFVRPLLGIERGDLRAYLRRRRIPHREDPSNRSLRHDRNRVRRLVVPVLADAVNPRAARHLVDAAARLREDVDLLDSVAGEEARAIVRRRGGGLSLRAGPLASLPPPIGRRVVKLALARAGVDPRRIGSAHLTAVLDLAAGAAGRSADLPGGFEARRNRALLTVGKRRT
jgi:tRNA(Ile)-lysidine synthase